MENAGGIDSTIYGEVNVSVSGGYMLQYAGGTHASRMFYFCHLKKVVRPKTFGPYQVLKYEFWDCDLRKKYHRFGTFLCAVQIYYKIILLP
jgi:hypothetical protein